MVPSPMMPVEVQARANADKGRMYEQQDPIAAPITFEEAVARALKYNLDYRLKLMESALAFGQAELVTYEMLPSLLTTAGYANRNNWYVTSSVNVLTGDISVPTSTSQERNRRIAAAAFSWDILDLGVSYFRARQKGNEFLMAEERRQRVIQNILQDVRSSYWRALGAQRLEQKTQALNQKARQALEIYRQAEREGVVPKKDTLDYQRQMLDAVQNLSMRQQELETAKRELAALMSVPPDVPFTLADSTERPLPPVPRDVMKLEDLALTTRPELREEDYRARATTEEVRARLISYLPNVGATYTPQYDSNKFNMFPNWIDSGIKFSLNLFQLPSLPATIREGEARKKVDEARRMALSMAVLTQVRVAVERYRLALQDYDLTEQSKSLDQRLADYARAGLEAQTAGELESIRANTRELNSDFARYAAYAEAQSSWGRIYNSLGLGTLPTNLGSGLSVAQLARVVAEHVSAQERIAFPGMGS